MVVSWCDKLASIPSVGIKLDPHFVSGGHLLTALAPITDLLGSEEKNQFSVNQHDTYGVSFTTDEGFQYTVDPRRLIVSFQYRVRNSSITSLA